MFIQFPHLSGVSVISQRVIQRLQLIPASPTQDKSGTALMEEMGTL